MRWDLIDRMGQKTGKDYTAGYQNKGGLSKRGGGGYNYDPNYSNRPWESYQFDELGFTQGKMPEGHHAAGAQYASEQIVARRNAELMQQAVDAIGGASQGALGLLESYRPGGAASLASGIQMQAGMGMANMLAGSRTEAPDLMFNRREREAQMARNRQDKMTYLQMGTQLASSAMGMIPGLLPGAGAAGKAGSNVWDALGAGLQGAGAAMAGRGYEPPGPAGADMGKPGSQGAPTQPGAPGAPGAPAAGAPAPSGPTPPGPQGATTGQPGAQGAPTTPGGGGAPMGGPPSPGPGAPGGGGSPAGGGAPAGGAPVGGGGAPGPMMMGGGGPGAPVPSALSVTGTAPGSIGGQDPGDASVQRMLRDSQGSFRDTTMHMRANVLTDPMVMAEGPLRAHIGWLDMLLMDGSGSAGARASYGIMTPAMEQRTRYQMQDQ